MSNKERVALDAMARVKRKELTVVEAAELMGLSVRQARRVWKRFRAEGDKGLVHKLRGRASNRRLPQDLRDRAVKLHQERYPDFGPTLACEKLAGDGLVLSPDTLAALLKERACGKGGGGGANTANAGSGGRAWARWSRWTGAITTGSRGGRPSAC